jgi:hypothetical protein
MTKPQDDRGTASPAANATGSEWFYPLLFALQTAGAALLFWQVLPIYRQALANSNIYDSSTIVSLVGGVLIQFGYWINYRTRPPQPRLCNAVAGHILLFAARLTFLLPSAIFSFLFITKALQMPVARYLAIVFGLFSLFCYVRELERLGNRLLGQ